MTYGDVTRDLHVALAELLTFQKTLPRLDHREQGGQWNVAVDDAARRQQEASSALMQRYRAVVLRWVTSSTYAALPLEVRERYDEGKRYPREREWSPVAAFHAYVRRIAQSSGADLPDRRATSLELDTPHESSIVDAWRRAAVAAWKGQEVELGDLPHQGAAEKLAVLKDATDAMRAIAYLDFRYRNVPNWPRTIASIRDSGPGSARQRIDDCARFLAGHNLDHAVDWTGRQPGAALYPTPYPPGAQGTIMALWNATTRLEHTMPSARNMHELMLVNHALSHELAEHTEHDDPALGQHFRERASLYRRLIDSTQNIDGRAGGGGPAVADYEAVLTRLASGEAPETQKQWASVAVLSDRTDARMAAVLRRGRDEGLYFTSREKRLSRDPRSGVRLAVPVWERVTAETHPTLSGAITELATTRSGRHLDPPGRAGREALAEQLEATVARLEGLREKKGYQTQSPSSPGQGVQPPRPERHTEQRDERGVVLDR
ncbi:hypothetical protein [Cellulosimicrobium sp. 22601]|uniref:hypothetical protein n=1 Tax=unclassified Cellulosimicrobium TaxID=2624466 RepID=UPI003F84020B